MRALKVLNKIYRPILMSCIYTQLHDSTLWTLIGVAVVRTNQRTSTPPPGDSPLWQWRPTTDQRFVWVFIASLHFLTYDIFQVALFGTCYSCDIDCLLVFLRGDSVLLRGDGSVQTICHTSRCMVVHVQFLQSRISGHSDLTPKRWCSAGYRPTDFIHWSYEVWSSTRGSPNI